MKDSEKIYQILVLGGDDAPFSESLATPQWRSLGAASPTWEEKIWLIPQADVVVLTHSYAYEQHQTTPEKLAQDIQKHSKPFVVLISGNVPERVADALTWGASGILRTEDQSDTTKYKNEIEAAIQFSRRAIHLSDRGPAEAYITHLLTQPEICFPHWVDFSKKTAQEAFKGSALQYFSGFIQRTPDRAAIREELRLSLCLAYLDGADTITPVHLRGRVRQASLQNEHTTDEVKKELQGYQDLESIEALLSSNYNVTLEMVAKERDEDIDALKSKIRAYREQFPQLVIKRRFPNLFYALRIKTWIVYSPSKIDKGKSFVDYIVQLNGEGHDFNLQIFDYVLSPPEGFNENLLEETSHKTQMFVFLFCLDSLQPTFFGQKSLNIAARRIDEGHQIQLRHIELEACNPSSMTQPLLEKPVSQFESIEMAFREATNNLKKDLPRLWAH